MYMKRLPHETFWDEADFESFPMQDEGLSSLFLNWHEAFISEEKIPYKLHSHSNATSKNRHMTH